MRAALSLCDRAQGVRLFNSSCRRAISLIRSAKT
jgi:hypothetical protein